MIASLRFAQHGYLLVILLYLLLPLSMQTMYVSLEIAPERPIVLE